MAKLPHFWLDSPSILCNDLYMDNRRQMQPTDTIRAELAIRRKSVGWLAATTGIKRKTLDRRLANPDEFRLPELAAIAIAIEADPAELYRAWASRNEAA